MPLVRPADVCADRCRSRHAEIKHAATGGHCGFGAVHEPPAAAGLSRLARYDGAARLQPGASVATIDDQSTPHEPRARCVFAIALEFARDRSPGGAVCLIRALTSLQGTWRRKIDDQPPDMAIADRFLPGRPALAGRSGDRGDDLVMPARRELGTRVEFAETALHEAGKIGPQRYLVLARTMGFGRRTVPAPTLPLTRVPPSPVDTTWTRGREGVGAMASSFIRTRDQSVSIASSPAGAGAGDASRPPRCAGQGQPLHMLRLSLATSCWTTSLSVGPNGDFAVGKGSALFRCPAACRSASWQLG